MNLLKTINPENLTAEVVSKFRFRKAARAVVFDKDGNVGLLHVKKHNYHKLPGGGVEEGEGVIAALIRECDEELGCNINIKNELGYIIEYKGQYKLRQESYCYIAYVKGDKCEPSFTKDEISGGFQIVWTDINNAINLIKAGAPNDYDGNFIQTRDSMFLKQARSDMYNKTAEGRGKF